MTMQTRLSRAVAAAVLAGLAAVAPAGADTILWKKVGNWDVSYYEEQRGCLASVGFQRGSTFFIGFDGSNRELLGDVTIMDDAWQSIKSGVNYNIEARFGNSRWDLDMVGVNFGGTPGLLMNPSLDDDFERFTEDFMRAINMKWSYRGAELGDYNLNGSRAAFNAAVECQRYYLEGGAGGSDPFRN